MSISLSIRTCPRVTTMSRWPYKATRPPPTRHLPTRTFSKRFQRIHVDEVVYKIRFLFFHLFLFVLFCFYFLSYFVYVIFGGRFFFIFIAYVWAFDSPIRATNRYKQGYIIIQLTMLYIHVSYFVSPIFLALSRFFFRFSSTHYWSSAAFCSFS